MFKLLRRVSTSFFPRPDRPWNSDATSNAPQLQIGQKRRHEGDDEDDERGQSPESSAPNTPQKEYGSLNKKQRVQMDVDVDVATQPAEESHISAAAADDTSVEAVATQPGTEPETQVEEKETREASVGTTQVAQDATEEEGVKQVTKGVREVEITESHQPESVEAVATNDTPAEDIPAEDIPAGLLETATAETAAITPTQDAATVPLPASPVLEAEALAAAPVDDNLKTLSEVATQESKEEAGDSAAESSNDVIDLAEHTA